MTSQNFIVQLLGSYLHIHSYFILDGLDSQTIEAYQKAKLKGERCSNQFKLVTLGAEGAGKSSTVDTLFNEKFDPNKKSTIGAAVNTCTIDHRMAAGWKKFPNTSILLKN